MDASVGTQATEMSGEVTDDPTSYLKALLGDNRAWNQEILFPDLDQEYGEVEGSPVDVSGASMVDNQSEVEKTGHVMHPIESEGKADIRIGMNQIYPVKPRKVSKPERTGTMDQAYTSQPETVTMARYQEDKDGYSTTMAPLVAGADLDGILYKDILPSFSEAEGTPDNTAIQLDRNQTQTQQMMMQDPEQLQTSSQTSFTDGGKDIIPLFSESEGSTDNTAIQLDQNQTQTLRMMMQDPEQLQTSSQTSFTDGVEDVQPVADTPKYEAVPLQADLAHIDLSQLLQLIHQCEPTYQPTPTFGTSTADGVPSVPDGTIAPVTGSPTTNSIMESGSIILGSTTDPSITNSRAEWSMAESVYATMGTPMDPLTSNSSTESVEIVDLLSAPTANSAATSLISTQTMIDPAMDLADLGVLYQQPTTPSSFIGDIPSPEPEMNSATANAADDAPTSASVKEGLKSKIQLKRLQRGEKELRVSFLNKPAGKLTEEEKHKIDRRKQKNKESATRSRLNRQEKVKRLTQENAEAEKEVEALVSEVEKSRKVRDVLQHWWDRRICHMATGFRTPPYHMEINDLLDALEKYLASEAKV